MYKLILWIHSKNCSITWIHRKNLHTSWFFTSFQVRFISVFVICSFYLRQVSDSRTPTVVADDVHRPVVDFPRMAFFSSALGTSLAPELPSRVTSGWPKRFDRRFFSPVGVRCRCSARSFVGIPPGLCCRLSPRRRIARGLCMNSSCLCRMPLDANCPCPAVVGTICRFFLLLVFFSRLQR